MKNRSRRQALCSSVLLLTQAYCLGQIDRCGAEKPLGEMDPLKPSFRLFSRVSGVLMDDRPLCSNPILPPPESLAGSEDV